MKHPILFLTALAGLAACDAGVESRKAAVPPAETPPRLVQDPYPRQRLEQALLFLF